MWPFELVTPALVKIKVTKNENFLFVCHVLQDKSAFTLHLQQQQYF
jgi:hypothetical protein